LGLKESLGLALFLIGLPSLIKEFSPEGMLLLVDFAVFSAVDACCLHEFMCGKVFLSFVIVNEKSF